MARRALTKVRKQPSQERSKATVDALIEATARVLAKDGYLGASTNRIAAQAGISIGSLYQYFPSKDALVSAVVDGLVDSQFQVVASKLSEVIDAPLPVAIRQLVEAFVAAYRLQPKLHQVLNEEVPRIGALKRIGEVQAKVGELLKAGLLMRGDAVRSDNLDLVVFLVVQSVEGIVCGALRYRPELLADPQLVDEISDLLTRYLVGSKNPPVG